MSDKLQANQAIMHLAEIGAVARLLPRRPRDPTGGHLLEVDVTDDGAASAKEIVHRLDPTATERRG